MNFLSKVREAFNYKQHRSTIQTIADQAEQRLIAIDNFVSLYDPMTERFCSLRNDRCASCGLMFWEKDQDHRYMIANKEYCEEFYKRYYPTGGLLIGKTDSELIATWQLEAKVENTFGDICTATDDYIKQAMKPVRFFEFGYINGKSMLLDIVKSPFFRNDKFVGSIGTAIDCSDRESEMVDLLQYYMSLEEAFRIDNGSKKDVAAYVVESEYKTFDRNFPVNKTRHMRHSDDQKT
jgi:hypothetical protein